MSNIGIKLANMGRKMFLKGTSTNALEYREVALNAFMLLDKLEHNDRKYPPLN